MATSNNSMTTVTHGECGIFRAELKQNQLNQSKRINDILERTYDIQTYLRKENGDTNVPPPPEPVVTEHPTVEIPWKGDNINIYLDKTGKIIISIGCTIIIGTITVLCYLGIH